MGVADYLQSGARPPPRRRAGGLGREHVSLAQPSGGNERAASHGNSTGRAASRGSKAATKASPQPPATPRGTAGSA
jgi:hypothetical protein